MRKTLLGCLLLSLVALPLGAQTVTIRPRNVIPFTVSYTTAQTDTAILSAATSVQIWVVAIAVNLDEAVTVHPSLTVTIGCGATTTPASGAGVLLKHTGLEAGEEWAPPMNTPVACAAAEDVRITTSGAPTNGSLDVSIQYYQTP